MVTKKILVVDDDAEIVNIIEEILTRHQYEVVVAHDGLSAIDKSNRENIDLILLDIRMPFFSGMWFCNAFKKRPKTKDVPIIVISGFCREEDVQKALRLGASGYVKKPFTAEELLKAIKEITPAS